MEVRKGVVKQHYNIIQLPCKVKTNESTGLSLNFHIAVHFEISNTSIMYDTAKNMIVERLEKMNIMLGTGVYDPLYIQCLSVKQGKTKGVWAGSFKVHLLKPKYDGLALLKGLRLFILNINGQNVVGKVCKSFNNLSKGSNLSVKVKSECLVAVSAQAVFEEILGYSFAQGHNYEITDVQKAYGESWAFIIASTPTQVKNMITNRITVQNKILLPRQVVDTKGPNGVIETKARKEALTLTLSSLPITLNTMSTSQEIYKIMGALNVREIWFHRERDNYHNGSCNVLCANPIVYRTFMKKLM